jgi:hypothetical protein
VDVMSVCYVDMLCGYVMWICYVGMLCGYVMWLCYVDMLCGVYYVDKFFLNFDLLHVPLLEVILHALFHICSYNTMVSSSYILLHTIMA